MRKIKKWTCLLLSAFVMFQAASLTVHAQDYWPEGPEVIGESAIVVEASTGTVLYDKNSNQQSYPASITKIMTTLLAVENSKMDEVVTFSYDSVHKTEGSGLSRDVGEEMTMEECLYGVMLESANEVSYAVAEHVGDGYDNFINMMNEKAAELGCKNTHFNNPHGLPDENHYTTAYDMALIARAAYNNEKFAYITGTKKYTIPPTNKHTDPTYLLNHHKMLNTYKGDSRFLNDECTGGKTGYTEAARSTLVTFSEKNGMTLICVVMREESPNHYVDTENLLDYCFENFQLLNVSNNETQFHKKSGDNTEVFGENEKFVDLDKLGYIVLPKTAAFEDATSNITHNNVSEKVVATLEYSYADRIVGSTDIKVTDFNVEQFPFQNMSMDTVVKEGTVKKVVNIDLKYILFGIGGLILLIGLGFGIYYLFDNFYLIKYKFNSRRGKGFGESKGSFWNRKNRRKW